jgi:hypothetical protein
MYRMAPFPLVSMSKTKSIFMAVLFFVQPIEYGQSQTNSNLKNATVLIIRHAEKPERGKHLSAAGVRRAQAYVSYFKSLRIESRPVKLDHLFAAKESVHSDRSRETLVPLSSSLDLKIHSKFDLSEAQKLAGKVSGSYSGETVLICWHHGAIPDLLKAFGANPKALLPSGKWPEDVFGWLIVLRYDEYGKLSAHVYNEGIMSDDRSHLPPST